MLPNVPVHTHIDLINEFNRKHRIHTTNEPIFASGYVGEPQLGPSNPLVQRLFRGVIALFGKCLRQPTPRKSSRGAAAHSTPQPR
jgi:hypothetical protein